VSNDNAQKGTRITDDWRVGIWNVRTMRGAGKSELLVRALCKEKVDICAICETRWNCDEEFSIVDPVLGQPYCFLVGKANNGVGGVGVIIKSTLRCGVLNWEVINDRCALLRLNTLPVRTSFIIVYSPTELALDEVKDEFYEYVETIVMAEKSRNSAVYVLGDLNSRVGRGMEGEEATVGKWGYGDRNENGIRLVSFAMSSDMHIASTFFQKKKCKTVTWKPPGKQIREGAQLDYVLVQNRWRSSVSNVEAKWVVEGVTDHALVVATFKLRLKKFTVVSGANKPLCTNVDLDDKLEVEIANRFQKLQLLNEHTDIDELWNKGKVGIRQVLEEVSGRSGKSTEKWISEKSLESVDKLELLKVKGCEKKTRKMRRRMLESLRVDEDKMWNERAEEIEKAREVGNSRLFFELVRQHTRGGRTRVIQVKNQSGELVSGSEALDVWQDRFAENPGNSETVEGIRKEHNGQAYAVSDEAPNEAEIEIAIRNMNKRSAPGIDGINLQILSKGGKAVVRWLRYLFELIWKVGKVPNEWNIGIIIPIYKKGDRCDVKNYRGITLMVVASKILERVILNRIWKEREKRCRESQAGFRVGRSCSEQIFTLRKILQSRSEWNLPIIAVALDFAVAYDSVDREAVLTKLEMEGMGVKTLKVLRAMMTNTIAKVRIGKEFSKEFRSTKRVKQGSILS